jgi:hypothetical protein
MFVVTSSWDVVLCCDDAKRTQRMGNVLKSTLLDIWQSPEFRYARATLASGRRDKASEICGNCSNLEYIVPGENVIAAVLRRAANER